MNRAWIRGVGPTLLLLTALGSTSRAASWPSWAGEVDRSALAGFESEDAVLVLEQWEITLKGGQRSGVRRRLVHVLTAEGRKHATLWLPSGVLGRYRKTKLWVRTPGGRTTRFSEEDGTILGVSERSVLDDAELLVLSPPRLQVGSSVAVETHFEREDEVPQDLFRVQGEIPVATYRVVVDHGKGWSVQTSASPGLAVESTIGEKVSAWEIRNVPGRPARGSRLAPAPPRGTLALNYVPPGGEAVFRDWNATARWAASLFEQEVGGTRFDAVVQQLGSAGDPVDEVGGFARALRYFSVALGMGGYVPRPPEVTLGREFGDCKDKTFLMTALLDRLGVDAVPVLAIAPSDGHVPEEVPSPFFFNHAIVGIPWDREDRDADMTLISHPGLGTVRLFDPTLSDLSDPDVHVRFEGGRALVLHPDTTGLIEIPGSDPANASLELDHRWSIDPDGSLHGRIVGRAVGTMRGELMDADGDRWTEDELRRSVFSNLSEHGASVELGRIEPVRRMQDDSWGYSVEFVSRGELAEFEELRLLELGRLAAPDVLEAPDSEEAEPVYAAMVGRTRDRHEIRVGRWNVESLPEGFTVEREAGSLRVDVSRTADTVLLERELLLRLREISYGQRDQIDDLRDALRRANAAALILERPAEGDAGPTESRESP